MEIKQTTFFERLSYYLYFFGQNLFYMIIASYISLFLLNQGLDTKLVASVIIAPQIWDVINDVIFGRIVDKAHLKGGKFLPWLRISWILIPLTTVLIFCMPQSLPVGAKCAWAIAGYCLWSVAYTMCDTPIYALSTAMTDKVAERNSILSIGRLVGTVACVVATLAIEGLYQPLGWKMLSIALSALAMLMMFPILITGRERNKIVTTNAPSFGEMIKGLGKNNYLIIFYCAFFLVGLTNTVQVVIPIFAQYVLGDTDKGTILLAMSIIPAIVVAAILPALCKKIDKFWIYLFCLCVFIVASLVQFVCGYQNWVALNITMALRGVGLVGYNVLVYMFTPDCVEYGHYKTGVRQEGITFSIQTCVTKLSAALMNVTTMLLLGLFGFSQVGLGENEIVDLTGQAAVWHVLTWISAIGPFLAIVILLFAYKLRDKDVNLMAAYNNGEISREECENGLRDVLKTK